MHTTLPLMPMLPCLLALAACSTAPKPPQVDAAHKRPANTAMALALQSCEGELHNTRIRANESTRRAELADTALDRLQAHQHLVAAIVASAAASAATAHAPPASCTASPSAWPTSAQANRIYTLRFEYGSTQLVWPADQAAALAAQARHAALVLLRGRTDGSADNLVDSRIARSRADSVKAYLVSAGVDPSRIRSTHQPVGDHAADNGSADGRANNRRVEIELYLSKPVATPLTVHGAPSTTTP